MTTDSSAKERAQEAASTAAQQGQHVAGKAAGEAQHVAAEAKEQVRGLAEQAKSEVSSHLQDQGKQGKDRITGTLSTFGDDLAGMAENSSGLAADVAQEVAQRVRAFTDHLERSEPSDLLDDVRRFARRRPGTFLVGSLAAGVVVGRLLRGTKDAVDAADATSGGPSHYATDTPRVTPGAPDTTSVTASHGQPTGVPTGTPSGSPTGIDPALPGGVPGAGTGGTSPNATGYSSPPAGTGIADEGTLP